MAEAVQAGRIPPGLHAQESQLFRNNQIEFFFSYIMLSLSLYNISYTITLVRHVRNNVCLQFLKRTIFSLSSHLFSQSLSPPLSLSLSSLSLSLHYVV